MALLVVAGKIHQHRVALLLLPRAVFRLLLYAFFGLKAGFGSPRSIRQNYRRRRGRFRSARFGSHQIRSEQRHQRGRSYRQAESELSVEKYRPNGRWLRFDALDDAGIEAGARFDVLRGAQRPQQLRLRFERPQFPGAFGALSQVRVKPGWNLRARTL